MKQEPTLQEVDRQINEYQWRIKEADRDIGILIQQNESRRARLRALGRKRAELLTGKLFELEAK